MHKSKHYIPLNLTNVYTCNPNSRCHPRKFSHVSFHSFSVPPSWLFIFSQHISFSLIELQYHGTHLLSKVYFTQGFCDFWYFFCISRSFLFIDKFFWHKKLSSLPILPLSFGISHFSKGPYFLFKYGNGI